MFLKPFRTKSNVQLKSSDRKKLQARIATNFAGITDAQTLLIIPAKASVSLLKIITHSEDICTVYAVDRLPMFFETPATGTKLFPTVYALWQLPELVPAFTTHPDVLPRLAKGANLMLPGVIRQGQGQSAYGHYARDTAVAVNLTSNRAAVGVGQLARSSSDLYMCGGVGVCVNMLHVFGDKLWSLEESLCLQIPTLGAALKTPRADDFPTLGVAKTTAAHPTPVAVAAPQYKAPVEHFPALGAPAKLKPNQTTVAASDVVEQVRAMSLAEVVDDGESSTSDSDPEPQALDEAPGDEEPAASEDDILRKAFLTTLKVDGRRLALPMLTSTFYRCHVVPAADRPIELKKTTYKKLGKFLAEMASERYITVREEQKGIEKIVSVNADHPELVEFVVQTKRPAAGTNVDAANGSNLFVTEMKELYMVTDATARFWARFNLSNGQGAEKSQLKRMLKEYVCNNKLQNAQQPQIVVCNEMLAGLLLGDNAPTGGQPPVQVEFDRLFAGILGQMKHSFEMRQRNEVRSSKNPTVQLQLATRSGNKKVTLVNNLEAFGIRLAEFEKACKIGVAASTTVTKLANQKGEQLLVQGNQIRFITKLLTDTYKIPPKNIIGTDLAKKEKKPANKK